MLIRVCSLSKSVAFVFLVLLFSSCTPDLEEITFQDIESISVNGIKDGKLLVGANARFFNPNKQTFKLRDADIKVFSDDKQLATLEPSEKVDIPANSAFVIPVSMQVDMADLGGEMGILGLISKKNIPLRFKGHFNINYGVIPWRINVDFTENISL